MIDTSKLNPAEKITYENLIAQYEARQISVADVKTTMTKLKDAIALELCDTPYSEHDKIVNLQARLKNAIFLELVFSAPEKAAEALRKAEENLEKKVVSRY